MQMKQYLDVYSSVVNVPHPQGCVSLTSAAFNPNTMEG